MDRTELVNLIDRVIKNSDDSHDLAGRIADCVMEKYVLLQQHYTWSEEQVAAFRVRDNYYYQMADIKTITPSPDEIPSGTVCMMPRRRPRETDEEWGARCVKIVNIGE